MRTTIYSSVSHKVLTAMVITAMVLAALPIRPAFAASISVNTTTDEFTSVGTSCSLREAIVLANNNGVSANDCTRTDVGADDIITLQSGQTYTLSIAGAGGATVGDLDIGNAAGTSGNLTIQASSDTPATIDASDIDRVLDVSAGGNYNLTLINIIVTNGNTTGQSTTTGGGISFAGTGTLTLINSAVTSNVATNSAGCGGGIYNNSAATVILTDSTINGNTCSTTGADGGGLFKGSGGIVTITNSTFSNNTAADNSGGAYFGAGTVTITNSTFANNTAGTKGGGFQVGGATVSVEFSTFSGNAANDSLSTGGGAVQAKAGSVTISTSILANSTAGLDCDKSGTGTVTLTNSLAEQKGDCSGTPTSTTDPGLGPLMNNGGNTDTMAIGDTSPAYNTATSCGAFTTDQRGLTRPQDGFCDLGAFELQNPTSPTVVSVVRASADPTTSTNVNYTVTFSKSVSGVDTTDFTLTTTGTANGSVNTVSAGPSATYTVNVNSISGNGTIRLDVLDDDTIIDINTNPLDGGFTNGEVYTIDNTAPTVSSITRADADPTNATSVDFGVAFSEAVTGVDTGDFTLTTTGSITGASVTGVSGLGETYTVTVNTGSGDGTIRLDVNSCGACIKDLATNNLSGGFTSGEEYTILKSVTFANVDVNVAGASVATYNVAPNYSATASYPSTNDGPVRVRSTNGIKIVASERIAYFDGSNWTSHSELMGLPANRLFTSYTFPYYNNVSLNSQLNFANVGAAPTNVTVKIGSFTKTYNNVQPGEVRRVRYTGIEGGPVVVKSSNTVKIIASIRVLYTPDNIIVPNYSEMMGLPSNRLSTAYVFPWYNNVGLNSQLNFANMGTAPTTVTVKIGSTFTQTFTNVQPGQVKRVRFTGIDKGPMRVTSSGGVKIIASMRVVYFDGTNTTSYAEMMGLPLGSASTQFSFPFFDSVNHDSQLRVTNVGTAQTTVTIYINGVAMGSPITLAPNATKRLTFAGVEDGPVVVQSSGGVKIVSSIRVSYFDGTNTTSYAETMGVPLEQLSTLYLFPIYNDVNINTQLRFGVPPIP
jgi:CSLREA domain-containing protein